MITFEFFTVISSYSKVFAKRVDRRHLACGWPLDVERGRSWTLLWC